MTTLDQSPVSLVDAKLLDEADQAALGKRICHARIARGLTQAQLAEPAEVSAAYLSRIEDGQRRPSMEVLVAIAERMHVRPRDLLLGVPDAGDGERALAAYLADRAAAAAARWLADPHSAGRYDAFATAVGEWETGSARTAVDQEHLTVREQADLRYEAGVILVAGPEYDRNLRPSGEYVVAEGLVRALDELDELTATIADLRATVARLEAEHAQAERRRERSHQLAEEWERITPAATATVARVWEVANSPEISRAALLTALTGSPDHQTFAGVPGRQ